MSITQDSYTRMFLTRIAFVTTSNKGSLNEISLNTFKKIFVDVCNISNISIDYKHFTVNIFFQSNNMYNSLLLLS